MNHQNLHEPKFHILQYSLVYEGRIKCFSCEHYATNAALTRLLSPEKILNMGHESTELSLYRYGGLQQIHHWTTWFSTAPRHRWIHLQPPERQSDLFHDYLEMFYEMVLIDPDYPRTSNMVEGFHLGFKSKVNRPKPSVQEYFRAIRDQQVTTDYYLDKICRDFLEYDSVLNYMFKVAEYFGHEL